MHGLLNLIKKPNMLSALFVAISVALVGIILPLLGIFAQDTYGRSLEQYIVSRNPQNAGDVENLTIEYQRKQDRTFL